MDVSEQTMYRMELQIGQLIRLVANLNERVENLEEEKQKTRPQCVMRSSGMSRV